MKAKIPGGIMRVAKARDRWREVYEAARSGDPARMLDAVQRFEGIANTMFLYWDQKPFEQKGKSE